MVCAAIGKRNKISKIIETYSETLQEKAEYSKGLPSQSDQMDCRILQKRRYPFCVPSTSEKEIWMPFMP